MFSYVARQAILDRNKDLFSYELLFKDGENNCFPDIPADELVTQLVKDNLSKLTIEDITGGVQSFIKFHLSTLLTRFPDYLNARQAIVEIAEAEQPSEKLLSTCTQFKLQGFKIALDCHQPSKNWVNYLPYLDFVKVDANTCNFDEVKQAISLYRTHKVKLVAKNVDTVGLFDKCFDAGFDYFQGYFFARPEILCQKKLVTPKLSVVELIRESTTEEFDLDRVNAIIERDISLSYKLLRFINNPMVNKSHEIKSLRHALNYLGRVEVKKFIALVSLPLLGDEKTIELIHLALVRAKFCELMGKAKVLKDDPPMSFLVGLFSLLDALLNEPMDDVVKKLPIGQEIKEALCGKHSVLNDFLLLIRAYEAGYWKEVEHLCRQLSLNFGLVQSFYHEALKWGYFMKKSAKG